MKWQAPSERVQGMIAAPFAIAALIIASPVLLPMIGVAWLAMKWPKTSQEWHPWFAWRPVPLNGWWSHVSERGGWAWLETVERRARPYNWPTEYRARPSTGGAMDGEGGR